MTRRVLCTAALGVATLAGCSFVLDLDALDRCNNGVQDGDESDLDCGGTCPGCGPRRACREETDCATGICPSATLRCVCSSEMAELELSPDEAFCVDYLEVTVADYSEFVQDVPVPLTDELPEACAFKVTHAPDQLAGDPTLPITFVDWCDAFAFCDWAGKRLCGGAGGGALRQSDQNDVARSLWFRACTRTATSGYPYGAEYEPAACNGGDLTVGSPPGPLTAGSLYDCASWEGVLDLSGNVTEWEDSCDGDEGGSDLCSVRGGSFASEAEELRCDGDDARERSARMADLGFRCCVD